MLEWILGCREIKSLSWERSSRTLRLQFFAVMFRFNFRRLVCTRHC